MAEWAVLNGQFLGETQAVLHFGDLALQRGYGIFDFFRLHGNRPVFLEEHLNRFYFSAEKMYLDVPFSKEELCALIFDLIQKNNLPGTGIRLSLTGGYSEDGFSPATPNLIISQHGFTPPSEEQFQKGIKLFAHQHQRQLPHVKSIDYLMAVWLQPLRKQKGMDDILYHYNGTVSECPRSNFFLVTADDSIVTPSNNILAGITRGKVIEIAKRYYQVEERDALLDEIRSAKEAFITSTTKQVLPVRQIDDVVFENHPVSTHLRQLLSQFIISQ